MNISVVQHLSILNSLEYTDLCLSFNHYLSNTVGRLPGNQSLKLQVFRRTNFLCSAFPQELETSQAGTRISFQRNQVAFEFTTSH